MNRNILNWCQPSLWFISAQSQIRSIYSKSFSIHNALSICHFIILLSPKTLSCISNSPFWQPTMWQFTTRTTTVCHSSSYYSTSFTILLFREVIETPYSDAYYLLWFPMLSLSCQLYFIESFSYLFWHFTFVVFRSLGGTLTVIIFWNIVERWNFISKIGK